MPDLRVRLKVNPKTRKLVFATDVHSVFDFCWYTLARKMSEDAAPEDVGRRKKDATVYDRNENEGVIMSSPFCGEAFIRRSNRAMTCGKPECTRARKRLNKKQPKKAENHSTAKQVVPTQRDCSATMILLKYKQICVLIRIRKVAKCKDGQV